MLFFKYVFLVAGFGALAGAVASAISPKTYADRGIR